VSTSFACHSFDTAAAMWVCPESTAAKKKMP
jgi:hypothetical protein